MCSILSNFKQKLHVIIQYANRVLVFVKYTHRSFLLIFEKAIVGLFYHTFGNREAYFDVFLDTLVSAKPMQDILVLSLTWLAL